MTNHLRCVRTKHWRKRRTWAIRLAAVVLALAAWVGAESRAEAQVLRPSTHPAFFTFGFGPSFMIEPYDHTQFKISQEIGYHFSGDGTGAALGASFEESFIDYFRFQPGIKFWYDIPIHKDCIFLTPQAKMGYALWTNGGSYHWFNFQFGFEPRIVLANRGMLFFRPITLDFFVGGERRYNFAFGWDLQFGGGVTF